MFPHRCPRRCEKYRHRCARADARPTPRCPRPRDRIVARIPALGALPAARVLEAELPNGVPALLLDCAALYARRGGPYQDVDGVGLARQRAALRPARAHRGGAGVSTTPARRGGRTSSTATTGRARWRRSTCATPRRRAPRRVVTIHNLAFQGVVPGATWWPSSACRPRASPSTALEFYGQCSFLKGGAGLRRRGHHREPDLRARDPDRGARHGPGTACCAAQRRPARHPERHRHASLGSRAAIRISQRRYDADRARAQARQQARAAAARCGLAR